MRALAGCESGSRAKPPAGRQPTRARSSGVTLGKASLLFRAFLEHSPETKAAAAEGETSESDEHHPLRVEIHYAIRHNAIGDGDAYDAFKQSFSESCA